MMFMPQRPYLPLGSLHAAIAYPAPPESFPEEQVRAALERVGLDRLGERLEDDERWDKVLSVGEQQRVAFARLLLHEPGWILMDEATSALDDENQSAMMALLRDELPGSTVISIAHRSGMDEFHDRTLGLVKSSGGAKLVTRRRPKPQKAMKPAGASFHRRLLNNLKRRRRDPVPAPEGRGHH
jgi:putative ATP-binding cassette transporter